MSLDEILSFMRSHRYAVASTVDAGGRPQAATVGIVVTGAGDVIFDTLASTRKAGNLRRNPSIALTFGGLDAAASTTVQYEGEVTFPVGAELDETRAAYLQVFPDGRERLSWPGILHLRVRPRWLRYSSFATDPPTVHELTWDADGSPRPSPSPD